MATVKEKKVKKVEKATKEKKKVQVPESIEFDASGKVLGRLATEVAFTLRGKNRVDFAPHKEPDILVKVYNIGKIKVTGKKYTNKIYWRHSGYPGGIHSTPYNKIFETDPTFVFYHAVSGMLPKNRLRAKLLKRLELFPAQKQK